MEAGSARTWAAAAVEGDAVDGVDGRGRRRGDAPFPLSFPRGGGRRSGRLARLAQREDPLERQPQRHRLPLDVALAALRTIRARPLLGQLVLERCVRLLRARRE